MIQPVDQTPSRSPLIPDEETDVEAAPGVELRQPVVEHGGGADDQNGRPSNRGRGRSDRHRLQGTQERRGHPAVRVVWWGQRRLRRVTIRVVVRVVGGVEGILEVTR